MENYMHAYILLIMNMKEIFSYSASKEWGFFTVRLWSLGFKRLDIYLQIHTHHSSFFYKYSLHAFCRLEIIFHMFLHMKNGSGVLILLAMYHSICWSYILIAKLLVIGYTKCILYSIITMTDFQRFCGTSSIIKVFTFQSKPYVCIFHRRYNVIQEKATYYIWHKKVDIYTEQCIQPEFCLLCISHSNVNFAYTSGFASLFLSYFYICKGIIRHQ